MKVATTIEQSRELLRLGLSPETADMYYIKKSPVYPRVIPEGMQIDSASVLCLAWSLTALFRVVPHTGFTGCELNNYAAGEETYTAMFLDKGLTPIRLADTPVDAMYDIVCWLLENGKITTSKETKV